MVGALMMGLLALVLEAAARAPPPNPVAVFDTTMGSFTAELYLDRVPRTVSNFVDLAKSGFYDGLHFHRVIPGFMNQGGPPDGPFKNLLTGETEMRTNGGNIQDEHTSRDSNTPGTLSMANTGAPNSGGSQFFINVAYNQQLDWFSPGRSKHPVFGKITNGMDVAMAISAVETQDDNPMTPIKMRSVKIIEANKRRHKRGNDDEKSVEL